MYTMGNLFTKAFGHPARIEKEKHWKRKLRAILTFTPGPQG
jgi:hypothetical protein